MICIISALVCLVVAYYVSDAVEERIAKARLPGRLKRDFRHVVDKHKQQLALAGGAESEMTIDTLHITSNDKVAEIAGQLAYAVVIGVLWVNVVLPQLP